VVGLQLLEQRFQFSAALLQHLFRPFDLLGGSL